ncbi:MAG TPA: hypothetical protein PKE69_09480, partial [Pyrinomonadaceae bacterium]|nr:hypothetical protein [Pyrinomonadaceae bacterium]
MKNIACFLILFAALCSIAISQTETLPSNQIDEQKKNANVQINQQDKYKEDLLRLQKFRLSGTLDDLLAEGNKIEKDWWKSGESYGNLMLEFLGILTSKRYISDDDKALNLSQNYVIQALRNADSFDFEIEWQFLIKLRYSLSES